ncbi:MAG: hypothetical protein HY293_10395, partial [Planctomycetes bacterium]|nr:hypothetical protein [Planctomycetota bacterium]
MDEYDADDPGEEREEVVVQQSSSWFSNAPWWLVSVGLHAVLILGATLIAIERLIAVDNGEVSVMVSGATNKVFQELERPRDQFTRAGIPKDDQVNMPTDEPAIFFPEAKESDHNESADNEDYHQMKGDSKDFLSYIKGEAGGFR